MLDNDFQLVNKGVTFKYFKVNLKRYKSHKQDLKSFDVSVNVLLRIYE